MAISSVSKEAARDRRALGIGAAAIIVAVGTALGLYLGLSGSSTAGPAADGGEPAVVEPIDGTELSRITLSASAIKRLDVRTAPVRTVNAEGEPRTAVPYSAVFYDADGQTWVYTSPEPRTFVRESITIDLIDGDQAVISAGPAPGTKVATVGVAELFGAETGLGQ
jgi:hypothetical protein